MPTEEIINKQRAEIWGDGAQYKDDKILATKEMGTILCWRDKKECRVTCSAFEVVDKILIRCKALPIDQHDDQYIARLKEKLEK